MEPQVGKPGFSFVKYRATEERVPFDVEHHFRLPFGSGEEIVRLKTFDPGERENGVYFSQRHDVVWTRINPKFSLEEVLHHVLVTELGDIGETIDGIGKFRVVLDSKSVSRLRYTDSWDVGLVDLRILVVDIKSFYPRHTAFVFPIFDCGLKADRGSTPSEIIQPEPGLNIVCDRESDLREKRWSPRAVIRGRDRKAKCVVERLVQIRPPEDGDLPHVGSDVEKNHPVFLVNTNLSCPQMKVGFRRIVRREVAAFYEISIVPFEGGDILAGEKVRW